MLRPAVGHAHGPGGHDLHLEVLAKGLLEAQLVAVDGVLHDASQDALRPRGVQALVLRGLHYKLDPLADAGAAGALAARLTARACPCLVLKERVRIHGAVLRYGLHNRAGDLAGVLLRCGLHNRAGDLAGVLLVQDFDEALAGVGLVFEEHCAQSLFQFVLPVLLVATAKLHVQGRDQRLVADVLLRVAEGQREGVGREALVAVAAEGALRHALLAIFRSRVVDSAVVAQGQQHLALLLQAHVFEVHGLAVQEVQLVPLALRRLDVAQAAARHVLRSAGLKHAVRIAQADVAVPFLAHVGALHAWRRQPPERVGRESLLWWLHVALAAAAVE
mmetsp:Transcript_65546/g.211401  ORF Transcript_65546/g.211401 Transcript_65546/m.211401 type:complete len:332 (-) Transcript_65546:1660-2655(-)